MGNGKSIDTRGSLESGKWINHSLTPNCRMFIPSAGLYDSVYKVHFVYVIAVDDIPFNREIFVDYGVQYFTDTITGKIDPVYWFGLPPLLVIK